MKFTRNWKRLLSAGKIAALSVILLGTSCTNLTGNSNTVPPGPSENPTELFISQYVEGGSYRKFLELYNPGSSPIDLSLYSLKMHYNGSEADIRVLPLSGTLEANSAVVFANSQYDMYQGTVTTDNTVISFNGNDPVALYKNEALIDLIGTPGANTYFAQDTTLIRKGYKGNTVFTLSEWDVLNKDDLTDLGSHGTPTPLSIEAVKGSTHLNSAVSAQGSELVYKISANSETPVSKGSDKSLLTGYTPFVSGEFQVEAGQYIHIYDLADNKVVSYGEFLFTTEVIFDENQALEIELTAVKGSLAGSVQFFAAPSAGNTLVYTLSDLSLTAPLKGSDVTGTLPFNNGQDFVPTGAFIQLYELDASGKVYGFTEKEITARYISLGITPIHTVQGITHSSPMAGSLVEITGVVTADDDSKGFYVQEMVPDSDERTSEAVFVDLPTYDFGSRTNLNEGVIEGNATVQYGRLEVLPGDLVTVTGTVSEKMSQSGLTLTSLTAVESVFVLSHNNSVDAVILGNGGRAIPHAKISHISGDVTHQNLDVTDGLGFFESIESMKVKIQNPVVVGAKFAGSYGNLYAVADNGANASGMNKMNGISINVAENDYNPEIFTFPMSHYFNGKKTNLSAGNLYRPGDSLGAEVEGIIFFGLGSYDSLYFLYNLTELAPGRDNSHLYESDPRNINYSNYDLTTLPNTLLTSSDTHLTAASFNVENMGGDAKYIDAQAKINKMAEAIALNLNSPDIVGLSELCDNDGDVGNTTSAADITLKKLVDAIKLINNIEYGIVNIDPENDMDGGKPGVNIRNAFIYNKAKVSFDHTKVAGTLDTPVIENGSLSTQSAVRIGNGDPAFDGSRKSVLALFTHIASGQEVVVIGNHLNSKRGDSSLWGNIQPVTLGSEASRIAKAQTINGVIKSLTAYNKFIVLGDMNDFWGTAPLNALIEGTSLDTVLNQAGVPADERATYIYNGNSQELDHMISMGFQSVEAENVNMCSPYPTQLSDHDPIVAKFQM